MLVVHMHMWKIIKVIIRNDNGKILNLEFAQNSVLSMLCLLAYFVVPQKNLCVSPGRPEPPGRAACCTALGRVRILPSA